MKHVENMNVNISNIRFKSVNSLAEIDILITITIKDLLMKY